MPYRGAFRTTALDEDLGQNAIYQAQTEPRYGAVQRMRRVREILPDAKYKIEHGKAKFGDRYTICYRCVNKCRQKAITILGKAKNLEKSVAVELKNI